MTFLATVVVVDWFLVIVSCEPSKLATKRVGVPNADWDICALGSRTRAPLILVLVTKTEGNAPYLNSIGPVFSISKVLGVASTCVTANIVNSCGTSYLVGEDRVVAKLPTFLKSIDGSPL